MKLMNLRRFKPADKGTGLANCNKDEQVVLASFSQNSVELSRLASHISSFATADRTDADRTDELAIARSEADVIWSH